MKKTPLVIFACIAAVSVASVGIAIWPVNKGGSTKKLVASEQVKPAKKLPKAPPQRSLVPKSAATAKPELSKEQSARIGQALHDRREKALKAKNSNALIALGREIRDAAAFPGYKKLALMCFTDAARLGSTEGMMLAGWCADKGFGMERNARRAFDYYFEAGEAGLVDGYTTAARMVLAGESDLADMGTAATLIDKALAMGSAEAKFLKGTLLLSEGADIQAGLAYLTEAAQADYPDAQRLLGQLYKEGKYVPKDIKAAAEWARYAADLGSSSADVDYAALAMFKAPGTEGGYKEAIARLEQAASQNNAEAAYKLASFYRGAKGVSMGDVEKTRHYATIAYESGKIEAAFLMATTYSSEDNTAILEWLQKGDKDAEWRSRYASRLVENEKIAPYDAVQLAMKATIEEARSYGLSVTKNLPPGRTPPQVVSIVRPVTPVALRSIDLNTEVKVQYLINEDGMPVNVQVTSPSPYEELNQAAVDAVSQWRYKPGTRDGVIVPWKMTVPVRFRSQR